MAKSKARFLAELLSSDGKVIKTKSQASTIVVGDLPTIPNSKLENSSVTIAGEGLSLGASLTLDTGDVTEHTNYKYYTDGRADARITNAGSGNWNTAYGWGNHASAGYVTSSGNTIIGTDTDLSFTGANVLASIALTDGVITAYANRVLTLANLGYTGETNATADQSAAEIRTAVEAATNSNVFTDADHSKLNAIEASATADQTGAQIKTAYQAETNAFTDAQFTKLSGIEASATADQSAAEIRTAVEAATNSNVFTDADHSKLNAIEASATADQSAAEIRTAVEAASDSNVFTDADHTKLGGIAASANNYVLPSGIATETYVGNQITTLIGGAPSTLNDLNELAAAINDDANYNTTLTTALATKLPLAGGTLTGTLSSNSGISTTGKMAVASSGVHGSFDFYNNGTTYLNGTTTIDADTNISSGVLKVGGTTVIDASRNLTAVTGYFSGKIQATQLDLVGTDNYIAYGSAGTAPSNGDYLRLRDVATGNDALQFYMDSSKLFSIDGQTGNAYHKGTITATGGNSGNWNTAYGWGNHASGGYLTSSSTQSKYLRSDTGDSTTGKITFNAGIDGQAILLSGATNFDALKQIGFYSLYNVNASGHTNAPFQYGAMISSNSNASGGMGMQFAHERIGAGTYIRGMNDSGDTWYPWQEVWTSGTDGSGSGLDADLLDGVQLSNIARTDVAETFGSTVSVGTSGADTPLYVKYGHIIGGFGARTTSGTTDWNHSTNARSGNGHTLLLGSHTNGPGGGSYYHPFSFEYAGYGGGGNVTQLALGYNSTDSFRRYRYNGTWSSWAKEWNSLNDGAGSGLDADLLDGQQGSYYAPATGGSYRSSTGNFEHIGRATNDNYDTNAGSWGARLQVTDTQHAKINVSQEANGMISHWYAHTGHDSIKFGTESSHDVEFQRGGVTRLELTSTGAVMGDATTTIAGDNYFKVDSTNTGEAMTRYNNTVSNLWYTGIRSSSQLVGTTGYHIYSSAHGQTSLGITAAGSVVGAIAGTFWGSSNDGAGSGLDADLLDGQHGAYYLPTTAKAADSNLFDGIDSNKFIYGTNTAKVTRWDGDWNTMFSTYNTAFIDNASGTNGNPDGFTHHHGYQVRHDNMSNQWGYQMMSSYHPSYPNVYHRAVNAGTWNAWKKMWDSGNDGSGSGLDADLLDGIQGVSFLRSDANDTATGDISFNGQLYFNSDSGSNYTEGARFNQSTGGWGGMAIGGIRNSINGISQGWWFARNPSGQLVMAYQTSGNAGGLMLPTSGYNLQFRSQNVWNAGNDGSGSGLDADTLDGKQLAAIVPYHSGSDFANGTLVTTNIPSTAASGASFVIEVTGKSYSAAPPHSVIAQGYLYNSTIINYQAGTNIAGSNFTEMKAMSNGGYLSFWWPRHGYWNSYSVIVRDGGGSFDNRVTAIANSVDPSGATKKVTIPLHKSWNEYNDGTGSGLDADLLDGLNSTAFIRSDTGTIPAARMPSVLPSAGNYVWSNSTTAGSYPGPGLQCAFVNGSNGFPNYGSVLHVGARGGSDAGGDFQIYSGHGAANGGNYLRFRNADNSASPTDAWTGWKTIWASGNDGSGSGLDADLLDGAHGSSFVRNDAADNGIGARTTQVPTKIYASNDNIIRYYDHSHAKVHLGASGKTTSLPYPRSDSEAYRTGSQGWGANNLNDFYNRGSCFVDVWTSGLTGAPAGSHWNGFQSMHYSSSTTYHHGMRLLMNAGNPATTYLQGWWANGGTGYAAQKIWTTGNDGSGSGLDADLLDGVDSGSFIRSDTADTFSGTLTMGTQIATIPVNYGVGHFGLYASTRYQHIWSMGAAYKTSADGTSYGNMYGMTYTHPNIGTGTNQSIAGLSHQWQHRSNGTLTAAIGTGIWTSGNVTAYSDIAVKTNLVRIPNALEKVCSINGYTYERTDYVKDLEDANAPDILRQAGVVAQEIEKVLPEVVSGNDGNKAVAYGNIVALLIESIKELKDEVDELKKQLREK